MEIESLFSSTRWEILKALAKESLSPMELAEHMNTTSANISQQLRLLELGGLVRSEKTSNVDKGKPRIIYSLAGENAFVIVAGEGFAEKKLLPLLSFHRFMMRAWFVENTEAHAQLAALYVAVESRLQDIRQIVAQSSGNVTLIVRDKKLISELQKLTSSLKIRVEVSSEISKSKGLILYEVVENE